MVVRPLLLLVGEWMKRRPVQMENHTSSPRRRQLNDQSILEESDEIYLFHEDVEGNGFHYVDTMSSGEEDSYY